MGKLSILLVTLLVLGGCSFQAGPIHLAIGDAESSSCQGKSSVDSEGAGVCTGSGDFARGSQISSTFAGMVIGLFDVVRSVVAGFGQGLASLEPPDREDQDT
jgi:hypothetical protein